MEGEAKPEVGEPWGFNGNDGTLRRGNLVSNPRFQIKNIPYDKYDIVMILGAGIHNVQGEISVKSGADSDAFAFDFGWNGGKNEIAVTKPGQTPPTSNYIVFPGLSAPEATVEMTWKGGKGWTGVAAMQIIPAK